MCPAVLGIECAAHINQVCNCMMRSAVQADACVYGAPNGCSAAAARAARNTLAAARHAELQGNLGGRGSQAQPGRAPAAPQGSLPIVRGGVLALQAALSPHGCERLMHTPFCFVARHPERGAALPSQGISNVPATCRILASLNEHVI